MFNIKAKIILSTLKVPQENIIQLSINHTAATEPHSMFRTATPLLALPTVRPVQGLSACTVELYLYSPYGPYGLYRDSVPVQ
jgi:hypothetical protein